MGAADRPAGRRLNSNDILTRLFTTGSLVAEPVVPTYSPSMDIQVSSNLERLLFELLGRDGGAPPSCSTASGPSARSRPRSTDRFEAASLDDDATLADHPHCA